MLILRECCWILCQCQNTASQPFLMKSELKSELVFHPMNQSFVITSETYFPVPWPINDKSNRKTGRPQLHFKLCSADLIGYLECNQQTKACPKLVIRIENPWWSSPLVPLAWKGSRAKSTENEDAEDQVLSNFLNDAHNRIPFVLKNHWYWNLIKAWLKIFVHMGLFINGFFWLPPIHIHPICFLVTLFSWGIP